MFIVEKRVYAPTRNSSGYPDGPQKWHPWEWAYELEFEDEAKAARIAELLQSCNPQNKHIQFRHIERK